MALVAAAAAAVQPMGSGGWRLTRARCRLVRASVAAAAQPVGGQPCCALLLRRGGQEMERHGGEARGWKAPAMLRLRCTRAVPWHQGYALQQSAGVTTR